MPKKPELMSPIKNQAGIEACSDYSDAVYFGVSQLNLRAAKGITVDNLEETVKRCHSYDMKAYVTINSTLYNQDLQMAEDLIESIKEAGADAIIVWDPAAIEIAKKVNIDFFISTQANVSNWKSAMHYKDLGAKRVILAREMTLDQIKETKEKTKDLEIESFIHGAMCLAVSGRCILSGFYENRSANRGACNQICRRKFSLVDDAGNKIETDGSNYMSPKDICMIEYIPEMIEAGIDSFKIEGRQRDPNYIETTAKYYRKAIEAYYNDNFTKEKAKKWKKELKKVYNRKFSTGFYFGTPGPEGINFENSGNAATTKRIKIGFVKHYYPKSEAAVVELKHRGLEVGEKITVEGESTYLKQEVESIQINGEDVQKAEKRSTIGLKVKKRVRKNDRIFVIID